MRVVLTVDAKSHLGRSGRWNIPDVSPTHVMATNLEDTFYTHGRKFSLSECKSRCLVV